MNKRKFWITAVTNHGGGGGEEWIFLPNYIFWRVDIILRICSTFFWDLRPYSGLDEFNNWKIRFLKEKIESTCKAVIEDAGFTYNIVINGDWIEGGRKGD